MQNKEYFLSNTSTPTPTHINAFIYTCGELKKCVTNMLRFDICGSVKSRKLCKNISDIYQHICKIYIYISMYVCIYMQLYICILPYNRSEHC